MIDRSRGDWKIAKFRLFPTTFSISLIHVGVVETAKIKILILVDYGVELK